MTQWLRAQTSARPLGVDREAKVIRGIILAEEGPFRSKGRGEFDQKSIRQIAKLANAAPGGLKSRLSHPTESDDGVGKMLGRVTGVDLGFIQRETPDGPKEVMVARGDLGFKDSAFKTPNGDLATYVMDVVSESLRDGTTDDIGMSLVLETEFEQRLDSKGRPKLDDTGQELPPLWRPQVLHAVDVVDAGDATRSMLAHGLSIEGLPNDVVFQAAEMLQKQFAGKSREFVQGHLTAWMQRALDAYFPIGDDEEDGCNVEALALKLKLRRRMHKSLLTNTG